MCLQFAKHINPKHPIAKPRGSRIKVYGSGADSGAQSVPNGGPEVADSRSVKQVEVMFSHFA